VVAWWGAILSTTIFLWDIYKWRTSGPKLRVSVQAGMQSINMPEFEGKTLILTNVSNYGDRPTTITNLAFLYYKNIWSLIRDRNDKGFIVATPSTVQRIPYELKQGTMWTGISIQDEEIENMARNGYLICALYHSHNEKPIKRRLVLTKQPNQSINADAPEKRRKLKR
jgi:hypothetical protein